MSLFNAPVFMRVVQPVVNRVEQEFANKESPAAILHPNVEFPAPAAGPGGKRKYRRKSRKQKKSRKSRKQRKSKK